MSSAKNDLREGIPPGPQQVLVLGPGVVRTLTPEKAHSVQLGARAGVPGREVQGFL